MAPQPRQALLLAPQACLSSKECCDAPAGNASAHGSAGLQTTASQIGVHIRHSGICSSHVCSLQDVEARQARLALRLRDAALRRVSHLEQIRDRAAISKEEREACPPLSPRKPPLLKGVCCFVQTWS